MNNTYHPKIISEIITRKVVAVTREAFVLHKILFCDHRKLYGRSRASPDTSVLPHLWQVIVMCQQNIKTYIHKSVICLSKSFRIPSFELSTFLSILFKRKLTWIILTTFSSVSGSISSMNSFHLCFFLLSCPVSVWIFFYSWTIYFFIFHLSFYTISFMEKNFIILFLYFKLLRKYPSPWSSENKTKPKPCSYTPLLEVQLLKGLLTHLSSFSTHFLLAISRSKVVFIDLSDFC